MSIIDALKNSVLQGFDGTLTPGDMVLGLLASLAASIFILFIYRRTMRQVSFNRSFCVSLLLVCSISAMMVLTITSNLALSLGMVGALSIVRFRTAVKDASDTAFLFWAVAAGITSGAGFYLLTLIGCLFIGVVCLISTLVCDKLDNPFLLIVRADSTDAVKQVEDALNVNRVRYRLSSMVESGSDTELIYELGVAAVKSGLVSDLKDMPGVNTVSLVDCRKG